MRAERIVVCGERMSHVDVISMLFEPARVSGRLHLEPCCFRCVEEDEGSGGDGPRLLDARFGREGLLRAVVSERAGREGACMSRFV